MREVDPDHPLAAEIHQEMAATYFAACRKMVASLEALEAFDAVAADTCDASSALRRVELLAEAAERVYYVVVQREAMQMSGNQQFFAAYGVPDEVRARMGPRRRVTARAATDAPT